MSIFKKAAPEPPAKVEPKESAYDLDIEADGDDPATAATVVNALYAKYKKNVRIADRPRARALESNAHARTQVTSSCANDYNAPFPSVASRRPRVPASPNAARAPSPRASAMKAGATTRSRPGTRAGAGGDRSRRRGCRCHQRNRSFPRRRETDTPLNTRFPRLNLQNFSLCRTQRERRKDYASLFSFLVFVGFYMSILFLQRSAARRTS